ncbi:MAG TPA: VOC family protein [Arsenicitalea sp.]|nr:VOC family protein [Arsenicitalea sp.]
MLKGFEHVGMTVADMDRSVTFYCELLGLKLLLRKTQKNGGEVAFLDAGGGQLELTRPAGPIAGPARIVPNAEAGIRHLTLAYDDMDDVYARLMAAGVRSMEPPRDAHNREVFARVAFVLDPDDIVVELCQRA